MSQRHQSTALVAITFPNPDEERLNELLDGWGTVAPVAGLDSVARQEILQGADALMVWNWPREFSTGEGQLLSARFVQLISAGADHLAFDQLPPGAIVASNVGAYAEPMAEHAVAMLLAMLKRLPSNHTKLSRGIWDQHTPTGTLKGTVCAILGYGGIGRATAKLLRAFGARICAVNTTGRADDSVETAGTLEDLDEMLRRADVVIVALPLTKRTRGLIGSRELNLMKHDAVLVNVARGAILDEGALYEHLVAHREFSAAIDAWWVEPFHSGEFRVDHPFFDLPNFLGSPHNSAIVAGQLGRATAKAAVNVRHFLAGEQVTGIVQASDYV